MHLPPASSPAAVRSDDLGGHRLVRVLGYGDGVVTAMVHAEGESRVARVFDPDRRWSSVEREIAVHDILAASPATIRQHVVALDDVFTLPDDRVVLLLSAVPGPRLSEVLAARSGRLELGEAVTILAPLVGALECAHERGLTGLTLDPATIRFGSSGAPVLLDVSRAVVGPPLPGRFRDDDDAYRADRRALAHLGQSVAAALATSDREALATIMRGARADRATAIALFDLATPIPVRADENAAEPLPVSASALEPVGETELPAAASVGDTSSIGRAVHAALSSLAVPVEIVTTVVGACEGIVGRVRSRPALARTLSRRSVAIGVAGASALVAAGILAFAQGLFTEPAAGESVSSPRTPREASDVSGGFSGEPDGAPEALSHPEPEQWDALVRTLIERWVQCRDDRVTRDPVAATSGPVGCAATQPGSQAEVLIETDDPRHRVVQEWLVGGGDVVVVDRMGGAAIVDLVDDADDTTTASLLLFRGEAGWRVRDVLD